jgi:hypothetical protein
VEDHDAGCHADGKAQYIDNGELPEFKQVSEGSIKIVDKHMRPDK